MRSKLYKNPVIYVNDNSSIISICHACNKKDIQTLNGSIVHVSMCPDCKIRFEYEPDKNKISATKIIKNLCIYWQFTDQWIPVKCDFVKNQNFSMIYDLPLNTPLNISYKRLKTIMNFF